MTVAEYLVKSLYKNGVTDVFGIPGGVVIDLLYTFSEIGITPHLSFHEQSAGFEACGYAQAYHTLGVAYATRGPGFTNLITAIADAFADSLPVLFITAHSGQTVTHEQRFEKEQEMDTVQMVKHITKYATTIDSLDEVQIKVQEAIGTALSERKGPVFLDFSASLWDNEISVKDDATKLQNEAEEEVDFDYIRILMNEAKKPIFLLGDGINQANAAKQMLEIIENAKIPVLSSRGSQDCAHSSEYYFGYIGSHGIRYANIIFQKADLVISIGNRLAFPLNSESFLKALDNKRIVRFEVDSDELKRYIPNTINVKCELIKCLKGLKTIAKELESTAWVSECRIIKDTVKKYDLNSTTLFIKDYIEKFDYKCLVVDVGNNEFWTSHAYELSCCTSKVLYSKSFGVLGCGLGKAIGAYYRTRECVLLVVGDQGIQINIQELQLISKENLPVHILIINNNSSGMIKDREKNKTHYIHTTADSGYGNPKYEYLAKAYGIKYKMVSNCEEFITLDYLEPMLIEYIADENIELYPKLIKGDSMDSMFPKIDESF